MATMKFSVLLLVFFVISPFTNAYTQENTPESIGSKIDAIFSQYQMQPGAAVGVFSKGEILFQKGYGLANLDYEVPVTPKSIFELASLSKQFTAACILSLEAEGKLSLDDPIRKYLPEIYDYKEGVITIRHLLHHTSGIRDYMKLMFMNSIPWDSNFDDMDALKLMQKQQRLNFKPGSEYRYSNTGHLLLALIVKRCSGMTFGSYAKEKLFNPLGMSSTLVYDRKDRIIKNRAIGYENDGEGYTVEHYYNFVAAGDGGIYTNVEDYFRWMANFINNKTGISNFTKKMYSKGILNNGGEIPYAQGLIHSSYRGLKTMVHSGTWGGFTSMYVNFPDEEFSVIVLSNNASLYAPGNAYAVVNTFFDNGHLTAIESEEVTPKAIKLTTGQLEQFSGQYFNPIEGYTRRLYVKNDTLRYERSLGNESLLTPIDSNLFSLAGGRGISIQFDPHKEGLQMSFLFPGEPKIKSYRYTPKEYAEADLKPFIGQYYSEELDLTYTIKIEQGLLGLYHGDNELALMHGIMDNTFNHEHFGHLKFEENADGTLAGFRAHDGSVVDIYFAKKE